MENTFVFQSKKAIKALIERFPFLKTYFAGILRGRMWKRFAAGFSSDPLAVDEEYLLKNLAIYLEGFSHVRFKADSPGKIDLQQACMHAIFAQMGSPWIPPEYKEILKTQDDPMEAFKTFLQMLGIASEKIKNKDVRAMIIFEECIGSLIQLHALDATPEERQAIYHCFSTKNHAQATAMVNFFTFLKGCKKEYEAKYRDNVVFPAYHAFMSMLLGLSFKEITEGTVREAREARGVFMSAHERYMNILPMEGDIGALAAEMEQTEWGQAHMYVLNGIAQDAEKHFDALRTEAEFDLSHLDQLEALMRQLQELYVLLQNNTGSGSHSSSADPFKTQEELAKEALEFLGFALDAIPTEKELNKAYRTLAKTMHPDVCKEKDAKEQFQKLNECNEFLRIYFKYKV